MDKDAYEKQEREFLIDAEKTVVTVLQGVAGAGVTVVIGTMDKLTPQMAKGWIVGSITLFSAALITSCWAAWLRHEYRKWNVKGDDRRHDYLRRTRLALLLGTVAVTGAVVLIMLGLWVRLICG